MNDCVLDEDDFEDEEDWHGETFPAHFSGPGLLDPEE